MTRYNEIVDILHNASNMAYVIGNGINNHYFSEFILNWKDLLSKLWKDNCGENIEIPQGITYTEFFDLIELNSFYNKTFDLERKTLLTLRDLPNQLRREYKNLLSLRIDKLSNENYSEFIKNDTFFMDDSREFCKSIREDADELSAIDCVNYLINTISDRTKLNLYRNKIKKDVVDRYKCIEKELNNSEYSLLLESIKRSGCPILTTNFDILMSRSLNLKMYKMGDNFTDYYPWNVYFSENEYSNPNENFAIWHINGIINYHRSIKLGLSDYMGCVERARRMLQGKDLIEYFNGKNQNNWSGYNTWMHIIFNKNLFIFGLSLDENEVFLRWLLIQRAKYSKMYNKDLKGWYIDYNISKGKRFFLEQINFIVIELNDVKEFDLLYKAISER